MENYFTCLRENSSLQTTLRDLMAGKGNSCSLLHSPELMLQLLLQECHLERRSFWSFKISCPCTGTLGSLSILMVKINFGLHFIHRILVWSDLFSFILISSICSSLLYAYAACWLKCQDYIEYCLWLKHHALPYQWHQVPTLQFPISSYRLLMHICFYTEV